MHDTTSRVPVSDDPTYTREPTTITGTGHQDHQDQYQPCKLAYKLLAGHDA